MKINLKKFKKIKDRKKTLVKRKTNITPIPKIPIRVLYKKVGQAPEVKIISDVYKLKKAIIQRNLDIIPYEKLFIICHNKKTNSNMFPNIFLPFNRILGDFIVVGIDKKERTFKSISQEDIIWYSKDLINKSPLNKTKNSTSKKSTNITDVYERGFEDYRYYKPNNFEKTLISVLIDLELLLSKVLKSNGDDKK